MPPLRIFHNLIRYKKVEEELQYYEVRGTANVESAGATFDYYNYDWNEYCLIEGEQVDLCKYDEGGKVFYGTYGGSDYFEFEGDIYNTEYDSQQNKYYYVDNNNNTIYINGYASKVFVGTYSYISDINEYVFGDIDNTRFVSFNVTFIDLNTREFTTETIQAELDENDEWSFQYPKTQKIYSFQHEDKEPDLCNDSYDTEYLLTIDFSDADNFSEMTNCDYMFQGNSQLTSVNFSSQNFRNVTSADNMFDGCSSINNSIIWSNNNSFESLVSAYSMFGGGCLVGDTEMTLLHNALNVQNPVLTTDLPDINLQFKKNNIRYSVDDNGVIVTYENDYSGNISIPSSVTIGGFTFSVVEIGYSAFSYCDITSITIPNSVIIIADEAFNNCSSLTSITIPSSVTSIGSNAFYYCSNLASITIPSSVTSIDYQAFYGCNNITELNIDTNINLIDTYLFLKDNGVIYRVENKNKAYVYNADYNLSGSVTIKSVLTRGNTFYVDTIDDEALYGISGITNITIQDGIKTIGRYAFKNDSQLQTISISNTIEYVGTGAFDGCSQLQYNDIYHNLTIDTTYNYYYADKYSYLGNATNKHLVLVKSRKSEPIESTQTISDTIISPECRVIYYKAFVIIVIDDLQMRRESSIAKGKTFDLSNIYQIGESAFANDYLIASDTSRVSVTLGNNLKYIDDFAFKYIGLTSVTIPSSVKRIGNGAFIDDVKRMTSFTIEYGVEAIGEEAFFGQNYFQGVITIPSSVSEIGDNAFKYIKCISYHGTATSSNNWGATYLNPDVIDNVVIVNNKAVSYFNNPTTITIPSGVTSIDEEAFKNCNSITSVSIPSSVSEIGREAFYGCTSLASVNIPSSISVLKDSVFTNCSSLTSIIIPSSVTTIERYAFLGCTSLASVTLPNTNIQFDNGVFYNCSSLQSIDLSRATILNTTSFFSNCSQLSNVVLPNNLGVIGQSMFFYCTSLPTITIPSSVTSIGNAAFYNCASLAGVTIPSSVTNISNNAFEFVPQSSIVNLADFSNLSGYPFGTT